ncbi:hypothetical protein E3N88_16351 [Mikania micrantha]|uniref:Uncharacterized protein n=1 Tax=Mikania micrantha TaxID=192012 RepID=A0A5N6NZV6_9ASTR|nr:hypothetical protein E3N88_16351 [Mikania micrantha]
MTSYVVFLRLQENMYLDYHYAKFPGKSLYALGRSWFKEVVTKKDKRQRSDDEAKGYLKEFVEQAKAAKVLARYVLIVQCMTCLYVDSEENIEEDLVWVDERAKETWVS